MSCVSFFNWKPSENNQLNTPEAWSSPNAHIPVVSSSHRTPPSVETKQRRTPISCRYQNQTTPVLDPLHQKTRESSIAASSPRLLCLTSIFDEPCRKLVKPSSVVRVGRFQSRFRASFFVRFQSRSLPTELIFLYKQQKRQRR